MKCKWYAAFEGVCINGECPYRGDVCPTSEHPEVCKHAEAEPEVLKLKAPRLSAKELAKTLRLCDSTSCVGCALFEFVDCGSAAKQQAADMLEKLEAEKDAQKSEWISVKDRPPEKTEPVNVTWVNHCPAPYYSKIKNVEQTATAVYFGGKWYWYSVVCVNMLEEYGRNDADSIDVNIEITHWMPLPKPPKEEKQ